MLVQKLLLFVGQDLGGLKYSIGLEMSHVLYITKKVPEGTLYILEIKKTRKGLVLLQKVPPEGPI